MKWSTGNKIGSAFCLVLPVLLVMGMVSRDSTAKLIDFAEWVHAHQVVTGLDDVPSTLKDAETGQQDHVVTREARYIEPDRGASPSLRSAIGAGWPTPPDNRHGA
jgi:CHASE3 domain sensor protein